jgi:hypothetical protein
LLLLLCGTAAGHHASKPSRIHNIAVERGVKAAEGDLLHVEQFLKKDGIYSVTYM